MYKIIKIEDYKGHWGIKLPQYQVVKTQTKTTKGQTSYRNCNKGGNFGNGYVHINWWECKSYGVNGYEDCERFIEILKLKPITEKSDSFWRTHNTYYPCVIWDREGGYTRDTYWRDIKSFKNFELGHIKVYYSDLRPIHSRHNRYSSYLHLRDDKGKVIGHM